MHIPSSIVFGGSLFTSMSSHALHIAAAEFAKQHNAELCEKKYRQLEDEGVIVQHSSHDR
jgi:hypothetical protein